MRVRQLFGESWYEKLGEFIDSPAFLYIGQKIADYRKQGKVIIPFKGSDLLFRAFRETSYDKVKVVILGQDLYPSLDKDSVPVYDGLAFSNALCTRPQPSLSNILKEVEDDIYNGCNPSRMADFSLYGWASQGVLLINVAHTVEVNNPGSHIELWKPFTNFVIQKLQEKNNIIWILWGNFAKSYKTMITNPSHYIIEGGHPSPLNTTNPFKGGKYFSKCNEELEARNLSKIIW